MTFVTSHFLIIHKLGRNTTMAYSIQQQRGATMLSLKVLVKSGLLVKSEEDLLLIVLLLLG